MRIHRIETILDPDPLAYQPFHLIHDPEITVSRGDRVILFDLQTDRSQARDVADAKSFSILAGIKTLRLYLLHPEVRCLRQISVTNQHGQTSVIWVGDTRALKIGRALRLHDSFDEWRIAGVFTAMAPHGVPEEARIVHVQEIDPDV